MSEGALEVATLAASELVTNACKYGRGTIELCVWPLGDRLRIQVIDEGVGAKIAIRHRAQGEPGGWGLQIIDRVALDWGVVEGCTHVWADLALG